MNLCTIVVCDKATEGAELQYLTINLNGEEFNNNVIVQVYEWKTTV